MNTTALARLRITPEDATALLRRYASATLAPATRQSYLKAWADFTHFCERQGTAVLPADPQTIALYACAHAETLAYASVKLKLVAVGQAHILAGYDNPVHHQHVQHILKGIRRTKGVAVHTKDAFSVEDITAMVATLDGSLLGKRDRAMILLGFAGALRIGEIPALNHADITITENGMLVTVRRAKCDQEGVGLVKAIPYGTNPQTCPVRAMSGWLAASGMAEGALFCALGPNRLDLRARISNGALRRRIKRIVRLAGITGDYSGLSLRAGFATSAMRAGVSAQDAMSHTGHRDARRFQAYVRSYQEWDRNPVTKLGL